MSHPKMVPRFVRLIPVALL